LGFPCGWGDLFIPRFDLVILLVVPQEIRLACLKAREQRRFGVDALALGGALHETPVAIINWAATYDKGSADMRSRQRHESGWRRGHVHAPVSKGRSPLGNRALGWQRFSHWGHEMPPPSRCRRSS
jgi:hypothetical protein